MRAIHIAALAAALSACVSLPEHGHYKCGTDADCPPGDVCGSDRSCGAPGSGGGSGGSGGQAGEGGSGGNAGSGGSGGEGCTPRSCTELGCGLHEECGKQVDCGACSCTPATFATDCQARPCEVATDCVNSICQYGPVSCDGLACGPVSSGCTGTGCGDFCSEPDCVTGLYACGDSPLCDSAERFCDPAPDGKGGFANACKVRLPTACGICELGATSCKSGSQVDCQQPALDSKVTYVCDETRADRSLVYVDPLASGTPDGTRAHPFTTYEDARDFAVHQGSARAIVIAGSPTFHNPLVFQNGLSVLGGYARDFVRDDTQRPVWQIDPTSVPADQMATTTTLTGARAADIDEFTLLSHVTIRTINLSSLYRTPAGMGWASVALVALRAPALHLEDVVLDAGPGAPGADGSDGTPPDADANGTDGVDITPGNAGARCAAAVGACLDGQGQPCGTGARGHAVGKGGLTGADGDPDGKVPGGMGGVDGVATDKLLCVVKSGATAGSPGSVGRVGAAGSPGVGGTAGAFDPTTGFFMETRAAAGGDPGKPGTWGAGGGAGGGVLILCPTKPGGDGGGGGGPGCGGLPGTAGGTGGASVALLAIASGGLTSVGGNYTAGNGGAGGRGGKGAAGGSSGFGETSGKCTRMPCSTALGSPGAGGGGAHGGAGGVGGDAGGGAGGDSVAVLCSGGFVTLGVGETYDAGQPGSAGAGNGTNDGQPGSAEPSRGCAP